MSIRISKLIFTLSAIAVSAMIPALPAAAQQKDGAEAQSVRPVRVNAMTLEECIAMAMQSNLSLEIAAEKLNEMDAAIAEANTMNMPTVSAQASYTRLIPRVTGTTSVPLGIDPRYFLDPTFLPDYLSTATIPLVPIQTADVDYKVSGNVINTSLNANYVIYSGGKIKNAQRIAEQSRVASGWSQKSAVREVRRDVTKAYYNALAATRSIVALDTAIAQMEVMIKDMKNYVEVGMRGEHELLQVQVQLAELRLSRQQMATMAAAAHDNLSTMIGIPVATPVTLADEMHAPGAFSLPDLAVLQAQAKAASTDIKALEEQLKIIEISIEITEAANHPMLIASAGYSGSHQGRVIEPEKAKWEWTNQGTLSLVAQWDIYDGNSKNHKKRQALSQKRQLELTIDNIKSMLDMGVKYNGTVLQDAYASLEVKQENIAQTRRAYEISYDKFQEGMMLSLEVLNAQSQVLQAEISYYAALTSFYAAKADLDYLVNEEK
jgi:outer membrane protein TolC